MARFIDRTDAGRQLAKTLNDYRNRPGMLVLGLARGGVPVAFEVATQLDLPLDVMVVRKLGVPGHEEYAMGAVAPNGIQVLNTSAIEVLNIPDAVITEAAKRGSLEIERREKAYRGNVPPPDIAGKKIILIDDGLATGMSLFAAIRYLHKYQPAKIIVAVPIAAADTAREIDQIADEFYCLLLPEPFYSVSNWYEEFNQVNDAEVLRLISRPQGPLQKAS